MGFYTVDPLEAAVIMFLGKIVKIQRKPGLSWHLPIGRTIKKVSLGMNSFFILKLRNQDNGTERLIST
jgi:regulator of protease activity HflC (stomatin/prohibitin superfamily)